MFCRTKRYTMGQPDWQLKGQKETNTSEQQLYKKRRHPQSLMREMKPGIKIWAVLNTNSFPFQCQMHNNAYSEL